MLDTGKSAGGSLTWYRSQGAGIQLGYQFQEVKDKTRHQTDIEAWWNIAGASTLRLRTRFREGPGGLNEYAAMLGFDVMFGFPVAPRGNLGGIRGRVFDAQRENRPGLAGVVVRVDEHATVTGENGEFSVSGLSAGRHLVDADLRTIGLSRLIIGQTPIRAEVVGNEKLHLDLAVSDAGSVIGAVIDAHSEADTTNAIQWGMEGTHPNLSGILIELSDENTRRVALTDRNGRFRFQRVAPGAWRLWIDASSLPSFHLFDQCSYDVNVAAGQTVEENFHVRRQQRDIKFLAKQSMLRLGRGLDHDSDSKAHTNHDRSSPNNNSEQAFEQSGESNHESELSIRDSNNQENSPWAVAVKDGTAKLLLDVREISVESNKVVPIRVMACAGEFKVNVTKWVNWHSSSIWVVRMIDGELYSVGTGVASVIAELDGIRSESVTVIVQAGSRAEILPEQ
ncbi:MAG: carboxypeptidase-like regulatory domain-containing protein [Candidatus Eisenbacteria bacterium]|uniref:Carboxypeptidase-like regulatory domain-containing protein n=1 Tax=Eiseniibacteriota bacterium TaxID=2212470 RepID=A0A948RUS6_UNCEI|nr:carboxypeptidase-like regulatory domain-containing protein [Candidatus Eisenbacteria bacterium]MBU2691385.1 carboxypeptidase-like regulatory domain-containing protein [Candidatus Eisenbacteria bacterium]